TACGSYAGDRATAEQTLRRGRRLRTARHGRWSSWGRQITFGVGVDSRSTRIAVPHARGSVTVIREEHVLSPGDRSHAALFPDRWTRGATRHSGPDYGKAWRS